MRTTIDEWRGAIPESYHGIAEAAWECGAIRFAKYPVTRREPFTRNKQSGRLERTMWEGNKAGSPRPLLCPESPPDGCRFELAWDDGNNWRMTSLEEYVIGDPPLLESAHKAHAAALIALASGEENCHDPLKPHDVNSVRLALEESTKLGASADAVALAFLAGFRFSTCFYLNRNKSVIRQGTLLQFGRKPRDPEWSEIITAALERHGKVAPSVLLKAIGGRRAFEGEKEQSLVFEPTVEDDWEIDLDLLLPKIEWTRFVEIVGNQKRAPRSKNR